ncbi:polysaccharide deacetylase family protein [Brevibacillus dissolubilis]|uniref:polysaccharide deacetylase family protein n=1 Tax=Brevibacillus dissolubilis TaxID=1844116 RepID=UPI00159BE4B7|nr:polysaccharide deacetylase family protein [Brevibacillus dissolubilis]
MRKEWIVLCSSVCLLGGCASLGGTEQSIPTKQAWSAGVESATTGTDGTSGTGEGGQSSTDRTGHSGESTPATSSQASENGSVPTSGAPAQDSSDNAIPAAAPTDPSKPAPTTPEPVPTTAQTHRYAVNPKSYQIKNLDNPAEKVVLLTFDDGPTGEATMDILNALDRHQAKSIWFVNGLQLAKKSKDGTYTILPEKAALLKEIQKRGHIIGNHTWWHENLRELSPERQREEIVSTNKVIEDITGQTPKYFRPPFGAYTDTSKAVCIELGMLSMNWSVGSMDWVPKVYKQPNGVTGQVVSTVHNGGNILFHDRTWTAKELDAILTKLKQDGYQFALPSEEQ